MTRDLARMFAQWRNRFHDATATSPASQNVLLLRDAEMIVRRAWLRELFERRNLAEVQLQMAIAGGVTAYEALHRAQRAGEPRGIVDAHVIFEATSLLTHARTVDYEQVRAQIDAEFALRPVATRPEGPARDRLLALAAIVRQVSHLTIRRTGRFS